MTYAKHSAICPVCKGNGYLIKKQNILSVWNFNWKYSKTVDCKMCHNQGEIEYEEPKINGKVFRSREYRGITMDANFGFLFSNAITI